MFTKTQFKQRQLVLPRAQRNATMVVPFHIYVPFAFLQPQLKETKEQRKNKEGTKIKEISGKLAGYRL